MTDQNLRDRGRELGAAPDDLAAFVRWRQERRRAGRDVDDTEALRAELGRLSWRMARWSDRSVEAAYDGEDWEEATPGRRAQGYLGALQVRAIVLLGRWLRATGHREAWDRAVATVASSTAAREHRRPPDVCLPHGAHGLALWVWNRIRHKQVVRATAEQLRAELPEPNHEAPHVQGGADRIVAPGLDVLGPFVNEDVPDRIQVDSTPPSPAVQRSLEEWRRAVFASPGEQGGQPLRGTLVGPDGRTLGQLELRDLRVAVDGPVEDLEVHELTEAIEADGSRTIVARGPLCGRCGGSGRVGGPVPIEGGGFGLGSGTCPTCRGTGRV